MVKNVALILCCLMLLPLSCSYAGSEDVRVIVATDLHYLAPELTDGGPLYHRLIENGDGKVMAYSEELIEAFLQQVIDRKPDALILSGDLTFNGERKSHEELAEKLARVEQSGISVFVIPGNHDLNNPNAASYFGEGYRRVDSTSSQEFRAIYYPYGYEDAIARDSESSSYVVPVSSELRILMVDVNATYPQGEVPEKTVVWIGDQLARAQRDGCRVIAVSHQNLFDHSSLISSGFTISNADALYSCYENSPVICNLSGHIHMQHMRKSKLDMWDIATSALSVSPNQYGMVILSDESLTYRTEVVDVSAWAREQEMDDPNLLSFADYAEGFFKDTARRQALRVLANDAAPEQLADFFSEINAAYFAGHMDLFIVDEQILSRWQRQTAFLARYLDSIVQEPRRNHCELTIDY